MRTLLTGALFALALLVAACGGGGKSAIIPAAGGGNTGSGATPPSKTTQATMSLYVPPTSKQSSRKPFYISPSTQAFAVYVEAYPSAVPSGLPSPIPTGIQVFPVATPSPCAAASAGGETCTFTVTAPIGTDLFVVAALPTTSFTAGTVPLSAFISGPVAVGASPGASSAPLSFTLNGIVNSVAVDVASPDPGNTPNTQVFAALVPAAQPLDIVAYDASGNQVMSAATLPYLNPVSIQASPAGEGLTLALIGTSSCGSSASGTTATIDCAGDLGNVQAVYDGTPHPDASDHLYDAFSVYSTTAPNPTPSPANIVLASNMLSWQLENGGGVGTPAQLLRTSSGQLFYLVYFGSQSAFVAGTFDPSTETLGSQTTLTEQAPNIYGVAFAPDGSYWVANSNSTMDCFSSITSASPTLSGFSPTESYDGGTVRVEGLAADSGGNIWYVGYDYSYDGGAPYNAGPPTFAGFFTSTGCATPSSSSAEFALATSSTQYDIEDEYPFVAALPNGDVAVQSNSYYDVEPNQPGNAVYVMAASQWQNGSTPQPVSGTVELNSNSSTSAMAGGVAGDNAGNVDTLWANGPVYGADLEQVASGSSSMSELLAIPPTPGAGTAPSPYPSGLVAFSPGSSGTADRMMSINDDSNFDDLLLIESPSSSPKPIYVSLPNSAEVLAAAYSSGGGEYALDMDANENLNLVRVIPTKTWWVPNIALDAACYSQSLLTILERGDSGPFTVSVPATSGVTATQVPGADHDFIIAASGTVSFTATVTDAHGRTEAFNVTSAPSGVTCGTAHRRLTKSAKPH
ncbi:MAG TPA: hypothetical protein VMA98_11920 [Candidatus Acidoferrales bacterium]|nr:hypothetical protein [Candidatus Acidoferrales bacterium]